MTTIVFNLLKLFIFFILSPFTLQQACGLCLCGYAKIDLIARTLLYWKTNNYRNCKHSKFNKFFTNL